MVTLASPHNSTNHAEFIVASEVMRKFMGMVERVARHSGTVLIVGETGTGKERIAHTIHEHSLRCEKPFVDINCAALPENLVESELFGHEKGAFSGADAARPGLFEMAHTGTIFLDEIGELDLRVQVKLLRVLDRAPYYRLGGHRKINADVRVVAATNRNLKDEVRAGRFRKDLYHRLSQFELCVPPLRERRDDIVALAEHLLARDGGGLTFAHDALRAMAGYAWPGNVRELQNVVNKVIFSATNAEIRLAEVRRELSSTDGDVMEADVRPDLDHRLDGLKAQEIQRALEKTGGHRGQAAVHLGISRRTLSRKLRDYGLVSTRSVAPVILGSLSDEERQHFRADVKLLGVLVTDDGQEWNCTINDISASGMGLEGLDTVFGYRSGLHIRFHLPDFDQKIETPARLAWADKHGGAGITFTETNSPARRQIAQWLQRKMAEEGWAVAAEPVELTEPFLSGSSRVN